MASAGDEWFQAFRPLALQNFEGKIPPQEWRPGSKAGCTKPSEIYRLEVDDEIERLICSAREPRIDPDSVPGLYGPYSLVRDHIERFLRADPFSPALTRDVREKLDEALLLIEQSYRLLVELNKINDWLVPGAQAGTMKFFLAQLRHPNKITAAWVSVHDAQQGLLQLRDAFSDERSHWYEGSGNIPVVWKREFVQAMGVCWLMLTGRRPTTSPVGPFSSFVNAAWRSVATTCVLDIAVDPNISFDRAIRAVASAFDG